jgi:hypothetical protein
VPRREHDTMYPLCSSQSGLPACRACSAVRHGLSCQPIKQDSRIEGSTQMSSMDELLSIPRSICECSMSRMGRPGGLRQVCAPALSQMVVGIARSAVAKASIARLRLPGVRAAPSPTARAICASMHERILQITRRHSAAAPETGLQKAGITTSLTSACQAKMQEL